MNAKYLINTFINHNTKDENVRVYDAKTDDLVYSKDNVRTRIRANTLFVYSKGKMIAHFYDVDWNTKTLKGLKK